MALDSKELLMAETLRNPVKWGEAYLSNRDNSPRKYWPHQVEDLLCDARTIAHLDGRSVGKCLTGDTLVYDGRTGNQMRIDELGPGIPLIVMGPNFNLVSTPHYSVQSNGLKPCFEMKTHLGRRIEATENHPFLTNTGWKLLGSLRPGEFLAAVPSLSTAAKKEEMGSGTSMRKWLLGGVTLPWSSETVLEDLSGLLEADVVWDQVKSIRHTGTKPTYDLSVPFYRNFVANGLVVHNSINLTTDVLHFAFISRGSKGLIAAPHQGQLDTLVEEIEFQLENNDDLMHSLAVTKHGKAKISRKPYFRVEFSNGTILYFRPAGAYGDAFRSLHVDRVWIDEAAWLSEKAWAAVRRCLNSGGQLRIYSTPNGLRNTTYYRLTMSPNVKVFRWPSWLNPSWTNEMEEELLEFYGGRDTSGWQHEVAGEHGKPTYGAFNAEHLNAALKEIPEYQKIEISGAELADCNDEQEVFNRLEMILNLVPEPGVFWLGGDLGYTNDPTELVVFREDQIGDHAVMRMIRRVHMEQVAYPNIAQTIALLDHYFGFAGLGVDYGGNGMATVQELLTLDKYKPLSLEGRLFGFHFGGLTTLAVRGGKEIRKRTKELMTSLIVGGLQRRQLLFPSLDPDIEDEFSTHTYTLRDGRVVYSKGNDHIIDAVRCAVLVREQCGLDEIGEETVSLNPVYTNPVFI